MFLLSTMSHDFHYATLSATQCVRIASNFSQRADFSLGFTWELDACSFPPQPPPATSHASEDMALQLTVSEINRWRGWEGGRGPRERRKRKVISLHWGAVASDGSGCVGEC